MLGLLLGAEKTIVGTRQRGRVAVPGWWNLIYQYASRRPLDPEGVNTVHSTGARPRVVCSDQLR